MFVISLVPHSNLMSSSNRSGVVSANGCCGQNQDSRTDPEDILKLFAEFWEHGNIV